MADKALDNVGHARPSRDHGGPAHYADVGAAHKKAQTAAVDRTDVNAYFILNLQQNNPVKILWLNTSGRRSPGSADAQKGCFFASCSSGSVPIALNMVSGGSSR